MFDAQIHSFLTETFLGNEELSHFRAWRPFSETPATVFFSHE